MRRGAHERVGDLRGFVESSGVELGFAESESDVGLERRMFERVLVRINGIVTPADRAERPRQLRPRFRHLRLARDDRAQRRDPFIRRQPHRSAECGELRDLVARIRQRARRAIARRADVAERGKLRRGFGIDRRDRWNGVAVLGQIRFHFGCDAALIADDVVLLARVMGDVVKLRARRVDVMPLAVDQRTQFAPAEVIPRIQTLAIHASSRRRCVEEREQRNLRRLFRHVDAGKHLDRRRDVDELRGH